MDDTLEDMVSDVSDLSMILMRIGRMIIIRMSMYDEYDDDDDDDDDGGDDRWVMMMIDG